MSNTEHTLTVEASTDRLAEVREVCARQAGSCGFTEQQISDICLAVDEAFTNIIEHAYKRNNNKKVELKFSCSEDKFRISLFDTGRSFSKAEYEEPDVRKRIKQKERGGVGVYLITQLMDEIEYYERDKQNEICMIKKK